EADTAHPHRDRDRNQQVRTTERKLAPQYDRDERAVEDDQSAHGRRRSLAPMRVRRAFPDDLRHRLSMQRLENDRPDDERQQQRRHGRADGAYRDVGEDVENAEVLGERKNEGVEHVLTSKYWRAPRQ